MIDNDNLSDETREALRAIKVDRALVGLVRDVAGRVAINAEGSERYVALRPSYDTVIACYVNPRFIAVRLGSERAVSVARRQEWQLADKNATSGVVHVPAELLRDSATRVFVVDLVLEALERSACGPGRRAEVDRLAGPEKVGPMCPSHFSEMVAGKCGQCE